jgi:hypothetical protein
MKALITIISLVFLILIAQHMFTHDTSGTCPGLSACPNGAPQIPGGPDLPHFDDPVR